MTVARPSLAAIKHFRGWSALRHRNYRLFFGGQLVSLIGTWMQAVAQGWLVLQLTGEPFWLGVVAAAQFGPVLVLGLFGGVIADGLPKRQTLMVTQAIAMVLAFALFGLTVTHVVEVWHVVGLALLLGVVNSIDMPTRQSFVVEMVGRDDVPNAIALNSAVFNGARIVGPAIAGITIGLTDISVAFLVNGITFLAVIGGYFLMDATALRTPPQLARPSSFRGVLTDVAEGLRYVRRTPIVLMPVLVLGIVSTFGMNFNVIIPALARDVLDVGASGYGFLMAATGIGSFGVAMAIAFGRRVRPAFIGLGGALLGLAEIALAMSGWFELSLVAMFLVGLGGIGMAATANTVIQLNVPDQLRGRVLGIYTMVFAGSTPLGGLLAGALASAYSVPISIAFGGGASLIAGLAGYAWYRRIRSNTAIAEAAAERVSSRPAPPGPAVNAVGAPLDTAAGGAQGAARRSTARG